MIDTKALRQKVLDLAIRGKLVPQDPNDEPASVLLERIRAQKQQLVKEGKLKAKDIKNDSIIFVGEDNLHYEKFADGSVKCIEDEIPFELPNRWEWCRLPTITQDIFAGGDKPENCTKTITKKNTIPIYSNGIENEGLYGYTDNPRVIYPSVTISARGTIGKCFVRTKPFVPIIRLITITPVTEVSIDYLKIVFEILLETGTGSSIPQLTVPNISQKIIPIPPVEEQTKICTICNNAFETIAGIELLGDDLSDAISAAKSKILDLAIRGKLVPQNPDDEPASVLLDRIRAEKEELIKAGKIKRDKKESAIFKGEDNSYYEKIGNECLYVNEIIPFDLPDGWEWVRLGTIIDIERGGSPRPIKAFITTEPNGINWIKIGDVEKGGKFIYQTHEKIKPEGKSKSREVFPGDFLLTNSMSFGRPYISQINGCIHDGWLVLQNPNKAFDINYLYYLLSSRYVFNQFAIKASGSTVDNLNIDKVSDAIIPLPPLREQNSIASEIDYTLEIIKQVEASLS